MRGGDGVGAADRAQAGAVVDAMTAALSEAVWRPACIVCCRDAKQAHKAHDVAVANARAAAEPMPDVPQVAISQAFTIDPEYGPVCWQHVKAEPAGREPIGLIKLEPKIGV